MERWNRRMKTRITTTPKKCLKFEGYIYIPSANADRKELRIYAGGTGGRLIIYDEFGRKLFPKDYAFDNIGDAINQIEKARKKLVFKRVRR
jgi:hypothetical protein